MYSLNDNKIMCDGVEVAKRTSAGVIRFATPELRQEHLEPVKAWMESGENDSAPEDETQPVSDETASKPDETPQVTDETANEGNEDDSIMPEVERMEDVPVLMEPAPHRYMGCYTWKHLSYDVRTKNDSEMKAKWSDFAKANKGLFAEMKEKLSELEQANLEYISL